MYLVSWSEENLILEASLGGRVTAEEMEVFAEEIQSVVDDVNEQPFLLVLDYSRTKPFDIPTLGMLADLKQYCLANGAERVVSVLRATDEVSDEISANLQNVMEGTQQFVFDPSVIEWTPPAALGHALRLAA